MSDDFSGGYAGGDSVTDVTTTGWLQRILQSFVGALIGIVLIIASVVLLWWNEGRAVAASRALAQGARQIVEVTAGAVDPAAEGKLVHLSGAMRTAAPARDAAFGVGAEGLLRLKRTVEMFQWSERKSTQSQSNLGGSKTTETTYSYQKEWSEAAIDSTRFRDAGNHRNPAMPVKSTIIDSGDVRLGAYRVDPGLLDAATAFTPLAPPSGAGLPAGYRVLGDTLYRGADPDQPGVGDIRIRYAAVPGQTFSVVAAQAAGTLAPYVGSNGYRIALADPGIVPAGEMFREKAQEEGVLTWILRAVGVVLMVIGFCLSASPLTVLFAVVPFLEGVADIGVFLFAVAIGLPLSLFVIAAAWIAHRPLVGGGLILAGVVLFYLLRRLRRPRLRAATAG